LVVALVERLLVEEGVKDDRGLAGLTVADDQLALAAADRDQSVDRLKARRHRLVHRLAGDDAGSLDVDAATLRGIDRALAVIGLPRPSTTRPRSSGPTGTSTMAPVRLTVSPSLMSRSLPKITTPTLSTSRFSAIPRIPPGNSTISPAWTLSRP